MKFIFEEHAEILLNPWSWELAYPYAGSGASSYMEGRFLRWYSGNRHSHPCMDVLISLCGKAYYGVEDGGVIIRPGSVMAFAPSIPHQVGYPPFYPDAEHLWLFIVREHCLVHFSKTSKGVSRFSFVRELPLGGEASCGPGHEFSRLRLMNTLSSLIMGLSAAVRRDGESMGTDEFHRKIASIVRKHIEETAGRGVSLESLSRITGYSRFHLAKVFKRATGSTIWECIDSERSKKYRRLLASGMRKKEIADELGFSCPAAFSHWLRKCSSGG